MATLDEAPRQLQQWITDLDGRIDVLNEQRAGLARALGVLDGSAFAVEAELPPPAKPASKPKADEERKARDRERKKRERAGVKAAPGSPDTPKYDYAEVAALALDAHAAGVGMASFVEKHLGVNPGMGSYLIKQARERGHDIPTRGQVPASNVTPIAKPPVAKPVVHEGNRAFTPDDTLRIIEGG